MNNADIVLVEDNHHDIEMIIDSFGDFKKKPIVMTFRDGAEALNYFFNPEDDGSAFHADHMPKLILLDLKLPKIDGLEVLRRLKTNERTKLIPVAIFSSSNDDMDKHQAYSLGANSYIVKPMDTDTFYRIVTEIGSYWLITNAAIRDDQ
jgi:two-component system response regulator